MRTGAPKGYCHDIYKDENTNDFLLVLWKSDTDSAGTLWGAQESATTGKGKVVKYTDNYQGNKVIWGRPCYYWIVPELNILVSIKFEHSVCDSYLLQTWVAACITNRVKHKNKILETTEHGQTRISFTDGSADGKFRYRYGFDVTLKTLSTSSSELSSLARRVTHIVKRETVRLAVPKDERADWLRRFGDLIYLAPRPEARKRQIEIRAEAKPTATEMKAIIEKHAKENRRHTDWENVGFVTDTGVTWVDKYRLKDSIDLDHDGQGTFAAAELYSHIAKARASYLAPLLKNHRKKLIK